MFVGFLGDVGGSRVVTAIAHATSGCNCGLGGTDPAVVVTNTTVNNMATAILTYGTAVGTRSVLTRRGTTMRDVRTTGSRVGGNRLRLSRNRDCARGRFGGSVAATCVRANLGLTGICTPTINLNTTSLNYVFNSRRVVDGQGTDLATTCVTLSRTFDRCGAHIKSHFNDHIRRRLRRGVGTIRVRDGGAGRRNIRRTVGRCGSITVTRADPCAYVFSRAISA